MYSLLGHVFGVITLAVLTGFLILGLLIVVFTQLYPKFLSNAFVKSLVLVPLLEIILLVQLFLFYGAVSMRDSIDEVKQEVETLYNASLSGEISKQELTEALDEIPMFSDYFEKIEEKGENLTVAVAEMDVWLKNYIWRRVAWGAGMIFAIILVFFYFAEKMPRGSTVAYRKNASHRSSRPMPRVKTRRPNRLR